MKNIVNRALVAKKKQFQSKSVPRGTRTIWRYLGALFILFTFAIGNVWGAYYTPTADEVIVLSAIDNTGASTTGYSDHAAVSWAAAPSFSNKTCGDPTKALGETTSSLSAVSVKGNGGGKNLTLSIAGCSKFIVYHEKNANRHIVAEITPDGEAKEADQTGSNNSAYTEITLDGTKSYSVFVYSYDDSEAKKGKQDLYVYAIKLIKAASGGDDPVAVTGITIAPSPATVKVGKTTTLAATIAPANATEKGVTWSVKSGSDYASVNATTGVVTGNAEGTAVITASAKDESGVTQDVTVNVVGAGPFDGLNYDGENALPEDYKYYGSSAGTENKSAFSLVDNAIAAGKKAFDVTAGGTGAYNKRAIEFTLTQDCAVDIEFYVGSADRKLQVYGGSSTVLKEVTGASTNTKYTLSYTFTGATALSPKTYSFSGSGSKVYISKITFSIPTKYTVTYDLNGGSGTTPTETDKAEGAKFNLHNGTTSITAPDDKEFSKWVDQDANEYDGGAEFTMPGKNVTLTAKWVDAVTRYTVTYDLNGASGDAPTETDKAAGDAFNLAAAPSWAGHAFDGWLCSADAAVKAAGSSYTMTAANTTFTAQWHELECKIYSFTGGIGSAEVTAGTGSVSENALIMSNTDARIKLTPATGETFKAGDVITISGFTGNAAKKLGVYVKNAAGSSNIATAEEANLGDGFASATLSADAEYVFLARKEGTTMNVLTCEVHRACAEGIAAGLSYATTEVAKTEGDAAFTNPLTNANGLVIAGYKSSNTAVATVATNGQVTVVGPGLATITANSAVQTKAGTLYAAGSASYTLTVAALPKYHVTYNLNGGSGDVAEVDHKAGEKFTLHDGVTGVTAPGSKTFVNWKDQDDALFDGGVEYTMPAKDVTLTAQWAGDVYTVKFMDGETVLDTKVVEVGSHPTDIEHPTKPLYTFAAWQLSGSDVVLDDVTGTKDATVILTARWEAAYALDVNFKDAATQALGVETALNTYHYASDASDISFEAKGLKIKTNAARFYFNVAPGKVAEIKFGNISGATYSVDGGAAETLSTSQLKATYSASAQSCVMTMTTDAYNIVENVVIHDPYTVSFDANGGDPVAAQYGHPSVTLPSASNGTASLLGWFDDPTDGNKIGEPGDTYTPSANITLYAHWEAVSSDARLASITLDPSTGVLEPAFDPEVTSYTYTMPYGTADVPTITGATSVSAKAKTPVIDAQAANWNDVAHIHGVAESDDTKDYYITMKIAPKDPTCLVWADIPSANTLTFNASKSLWNEEDVTLAINGVSGKDGSAPSGVKFQKPGYIKIQKNEGSFQIGDIVALDVTYLSGSTMHVFKVQEPSTDADVIGTGTTATTPAGVNKVAITEDAATLWLARPNNESAYKDWNPHVDYVAVYRIMNPLLKAITINGEAGVIDEGLKTVAVELQPGYDLAALTIVPTIVSNTAEADVVKTVESNSGNWIIGDNTYRLTDKDGDYTEYTITLSAGALKHTVTFDAQGGSAVDPQQVVDGENPVVPTAPTKDDYIFQGWSETADGAVVDVTTFIINAPKTFYAIWASDGAIKLLDGSTVNHTNFITGVTASTVEIESVDYNCVATAGNTSAVNNGNTKNHDRVIAYNATTTQTKIQLSLYNSNGDARSIEVKGVVEGTTDIVDLGTINLTGKEKKVTEYIEFNNAKNRTIYIYTTSNAGHIKILQVKVLETGTALPMAGDAGYSFNLNQGRLFGKQLDAFNFEGLDIENLAADYTPLSTSVGRFALGKSISFDVTSDVTMSLTAANNKTYYVTKAAAGTDNETSKTGVSEFALTAGTWYITAGTEDMQFTNIAFTAPKCEQPTVADMANSDLCEGDAFIALTVSASVTDGGTLHYQWYKHPAEGDDEEVGTDDASYTPTADGQYYVIVTNKLADHTDNAKTSNTVTVAHFASAAITTAPENQRKEAGQVATLTVVATGKAPLTYQWYTCDDEAGNNPVIIDGADEATYEVTVTAAMSQYYKVVVGSGCGSAEAVALVEEWHEVTPANVTGSITWNWAGSAWDGISGDIAFENTGVEQLMANVSSKVPVSDAGNFRADMLYGTGLYVWRSGNKFFQGTKIRFITEVPGFLTVHYRNTSGSTNTRKIEVVNNGETLAEDGTSTTNNWKWTNKVFVQAGEVILNGIASEANGLTRIDQVVFDATPDYSRPVSSNFGTLCVEHNVPAGQYFGATFYQIASRNEDYDYKIDFEEVLPNEELKAGEPYLFKSNTGRIDLFYGEETAANPIPVRGMIGNYGPSQLAITAANMNTIYYFAQNKLWLCDNLVGSNLILNEHRAYIDLTQVPTYAEYEASKQQQQNSAPRRRVSLEMNGEQVATGCENLNVSDKPVKMIINGQLFILRGEKMYDAKGQLVK